jgi:hypothetical protein
MAEYLNNHYHNTFWSIIEEHFSLIQRLYADYYVTFDSIHSELEHYCRKYPLINQAMLETRVYIGNLYPIVQLNCANQRLLR